jgi:hypothetical protein
MSSNSDNKKDASATNASQPAQQRDGQEVRVAQINLAVAIITGLITLAGVIVTALLAPIALEIVRHRLSATATPAPIAVETIAPIPASFATDSSDLLLPIFTETIPPSPANPPTPTPQAAAETMTAQLTFSSSAGNAPLLVNFNARNSYLTRANQPTLTCIEKNVCSYTWSVRMGGTTIYGPSLGDSAFSYTFQKKGEYTVVVTVCRGDACNFAAASISVK